MSSDSWKNKKIQIFTTVIDNLSMEEAKEKIRGFLEEKSFHRVYTPNTEIVMEAKKDYNLTKLVNSANLVVADGIGLVIGSKLRSLPLKERVTGYDLSMYLLDYAQEKNLGVYLLGGAPGVSEKASIRLAKERPDLKILGYNNGYFKGSHTGYENHEEENEVLRKINESGAQILFVGLGFPRQEIWIDKNKDKLPDVRLAIGNGGVIDVLAGVAKRAPKIFIQLHLEWFYRLMKNPSRIKRQLAIPKFLWEIMNNPGAVKSVIRNVEEKK